MNRQEYLDSPYPRTAAHRQYYGQYVSERVKTLVLGWFGRKAIVGSDDPHFNDLPLERWDALVRSLPAEIATALRERGDGMSLSSGVCILKEAAEQIRDEARKV